MTILILNFLFCTFLLCCMAIGTTCPYGPKAIQYINIGRPYNVEGKGNDGRGCNKPEICDLTKQINFKYMSATSALHPHTPTVPSLMLCFQWHSAIIAGNERTWPAWFAAVIVGFSCRLCLNAALMLSFFVRKCFHSRCAIQDMVQRLQSVTMCFLLFLFAWSPCLQ